MVKYEIIEVISGWYIKIKTKYFKLDLSYEVSSAQRDERIKKKNIKFI